MDVTMDIPVEGASAGKVDRLEARQTWSNSGMPRSKTGPMAGMDQLNCGPSQKKANQKSGQTGLQSVVMKLMGPKSDMNSTQSSFGAASSLGDFVPSTPGTAGSTEEVSFAVCAEDGQHFAQGLISGSMAVAFRGRWHGCIAASEGSTKNK
ncbi:SEC1A [Symbiodinium sp. CCMP2592]|nr:SEC1A [Symbiodinium sp. CCMP2592]